MQLIKMYMLKICLSLFKLLLCLTGKSHNNARSLIMKVERDELVEEVLKTYIENSAWD